VHTDQSISAKHTQAHNVITMGEHQHWLFS